MSFESRNLGESTGFAGLLAQELEKGNNNKTYNVSSIDIQNTTLKFQSHQATEDNFIVVNAPLPVYSNSQIANYIQSGYFGTDYKWNMSGSGTAPQSGILTYNTNGLNASGVFLADQSLELYETILGIDFVKVAGAADLNFDDNQGGAFASFSASGTTITSASVNISTAWLTNYGTTIGTYSFQTYLHEIGHALGLGHGGPYNGVGNYVTDTTDPNYLNNSNIYLNDSWQATMMSYFSQSENTYVNASFAFLISPMVADWVALSSKYGSSAAAFSGNTIWGFNTNIVSTAYANLAAYADEFAFTIFDTNGIDTVNFSGYSVNQYINLNAEAISDVGGLTGNMIIARGTLIENAIGGSGSDVLRGNVAANQLTGGAGADQLEGLAGADALLGGLGQDVLLGGDGDDALNGNSGTDTLDGGAGYDTATYTETVRVDLTAGTVQFIGQTWTPETVTLVEAVVAGAGADVLLGSAAANRFTGGGGNDAFERFGSGDVFDGGTGTDTVLFTNATAAVQADLGTGNVAFPGQALAAGRLIGVENVVGGVAADVLTGSSGANLIRGGRGADTIAGAGGADVIVGGQGDDFFVYRGLADSAPGAADILRAGDSSIAFYNPGANPGDRIDLRLIDANTGVTGDQGFTFGTSTGAGRLWLAEVNDTTVVRCNVNASAAWEFECVIEDGATRSLVYSAADFLL